MPSIKKLTPAAIRIMEGKLAALLPYQGAVKGSRSTNKHLDKYRRTQNAMYEWHNNGNINSESGTKSIFGFSTSEMSRYGNHGRRPDFERSKKIIDPIFARNTVAAYKEQFGLKELQKRLPNASETRNMANRKLVKVAKQEKSWAEKAVARAQGDLTKAQAKLATFK